LHASIAAGKRQLDTDVLALDAMGEPAAPGRLSLRASEGLVHPLGDGGPGEAHFVVEVPRRVGAGALALTGVAAGTPVARGDLAVPLVAGKPHELSLSPSLRHLVIGGGAQARIVVSAHDQFGNPTSADHAEASLDGAPVPIRSTAGGLGILVVPPPTIYDGKDRLTVDVTLGKVRALHLRHVDPEDGRQTDVWLGIDQHYLPVKMRYPVAKMRLMVEQSAARISER